MDEVLQIALERPLSPVTEVVPEVRPEFQPDIIQDGELTN
jgi:hypothetical protein